MKDRRVYKVYIGDKFNRLEIIDIIQAKFSDTHRTKYKCLCTCGNISYATASQLVKNVIRSCGCLQRENLIVFNKKTKIKHGCINTREYNAWRSMKSRCYYKSNISYSRYGEIGIVVCSGWLYSFENFITDVGLKPTNIHQIDRINNNGNYSCGKCSECIENNWPMNVRWATPVEQSNNKCDNVLISFNNRKMTLAEFSKLIRINYNTVWLRFNAGWDIDRIADTPLRINRKI